MRVRGGARGVGRCVVRRVAWRPPAACAHSPPPQVKAVEYWMKEAFASPRGHASLVAASEFVHFGVTSEDVSNCAYALLVRDARARVLLPAMRGVVEAVAAAAESLAGAALLSRTHGQPATPTTMGKELAVFAARLSAAGAAVAAVAPRGKWSGAVGAHNATRAAYPAVDWRATSDAFVRERLALAPAPLCTQIEPHDWLAELSHALSRFNGVLLGLDRDAWGYISRGYFKQRTVAGEVGSSTMPHKVNPIDFENSEGNLGLANALLRHLSEKLPVSRWQRDLTDSTVLRNMGVALGYALLAWDSCLKGLNKLEANRAAMTDDLDDNWEVLAEPIQTVMRRYNVAGAYEQLKELTRGKAGINRETLHAFIKGLSGIPEAEKQRLLALTPANYIGKAIELAQRI